MSALRNVRRQLFALFAISLGTAAVVYAWPQTRQEDPNSLAGVGSEVRMLRLTIENSLRSQTEMNAMGVLLATVQSRITQLTSRLDSVREAAKLASEKTRDANEQLARFQSSLSSITDPAARAEHTRIIAGIKQAADNDYAREQELRTSESQLSGELRAEEARWTDLVTRLEQLTKR